MQKDKKECCPKFNPNRWDKKIFNWKDKHFIKETIPEFFHIPFPPMIGKKITKMWNMAKASKKTIAKKEDALILFTDPNPFKGEIYMSVTEDVPNANNVKFSGTFMGMVFAGPYNAIPKYMKEMEKYLISKGKKAKKYYVHYAYCPICAKKFGKNYMILFAQIE